jgi:lipopolysaccharide transport system permease protein
MSELMDDGPDVVSLTPGSALNDPRRLFRDMRRDLVASRELAWRLFVRNISVRYRQSILGYVWVFIPPVFTTLVFVFLRQARFLNVPDTSVHYLAFLLTGLILWEVFAEAMNSPIRMVTQSTAMLAKVNFPREALLLAGIGDVLLSLAIRMVLLGAVLIWLDVRLTWTAALFPLGVLTLIAFGVALGVFLTPFAILYQDLGLALQLILTLWMLLTPVIYPPPSSWPASLTMILNPVSPVLDTTRVWLLGGSPQHLIGFAIVAGITIAALFIGWVLYRIALPVLVERISA